MNAETLLNQAAVLWTQLQGAVAAHPDLAGVAVALVVGGLIAGLALAVGSLLRLLGRMRIAGRMAAIRRSSDVGVRVLVLTGGGGRIGHIAHFAQETVSSHFADYMFGGPFKVFPVKAIAASEADATRMLKQSEADLVLWAERGSPPARGVMRLASRQASPGEKARPAQTLAMPKQRADWSKALSRAMAYAAAKQFRPALGRPQDFRSERLQPVVESLSDILDQKPKADPALLAAMADDLCAGALQLAGTDMPDWLERSVAIARATLGDINRSAAPDRWIAAKINLGRALRLQCERRFDPVVLQEGITHLTDALEALRSEPRFKLAEAAANALSDCQRLLGARRRFSISGGRI